MRDEIHVLDWGSIEGRTVLLDGHGQPLQPGAKPVWLPFRIEDCGNARNSAGVLFQPNITADDFVRQYDPFGVDALIR